MVPFLSLRLPIAIGYHKASEGGKMVAISFCQMKGINTPPSASPGLRRLSLLFRPKGRGMDTYILKERIADQSDHHFKCSESIDRILMPHTAVRITSQ